MMSLMAHTFEFETQRTIIGILTDKRTTIALHLQ